MDWKATDIQNIARKWQNKEGALLPILHDIQHAYGYVDSAMVDIIAKEINYSRAEVHGAVTFYHDFKKQPAKPTRIQICCAEACQAMGSRELVEHVEKKYKVEIGSHNDQVQIEKVYCLGNCACAPALVYNGRLHGRITADNYDSLTETL